MGSQKLSSRLPRTESTRVQALLLALVAVPAAGLLVAGPGAGVAQARTVSYPDKDSFVMKTTGAELKASTVTFNSKTVYNRNYNLWDTLDDKRCAGIYEARFYTDGKIEGPYFVTGTCDRQTNLLVMDVTSPKPLKSLKVFLCRRTTANEPADCVTTMTTPGID